MHSALGALSGHAETYAVPPIQLACRISALAGTADWRLFKSSHSPIYTSRRDQKNRVPARVRSELRLKIVVITVIERVEIPKQPVSLFAVSNKKLYYPFGVSLPYSLSFWPRRTILLF